MSGDGVVTLGATSGGVSTPATYAAARTTARSDLNSDIFYLKGRTSAADGGEGFFEWINNTGVVGDDDGGITLVNTTTGDTYRRVGYTHKSRINVNWFGVVTSTGASPVDVTSEFIAMIERFPLSPLFWPMGEPNDGYYITVDIQADTNLTTMKANLANLSTAQKDNWEYCPDWIGEGGVGEPEEPCTTLRPADPSSDNYIFRFSRRTAPEDRPFYHGHFKSMRFWGNATTPIDVDALLYFENTGAWSVFEDCEFRYADVGVRIAGQWSFVFDNCIFGDRAHSDSSDSKGLMVGTWSHDWEVTGQQPKYAGGHQYINTTISCYHCGILSDNRFNANPGIGDYYRGCDLENNSRLTWIYIHHGNEWEPAVMPKIYREAQPAQDPESDPDPLSPGDGQINLSRFDRTHDFDDGEIGVATSTIGVVTYAETPVTSESERNAFQFIGKGSYYIQSTNEPLTLLKDSQSLAQQNVDKGNPLRDQRGPTVYLECDRSSREHVKDADSRIILGQANPIGSGGGTRNIPAKRVNQPDASTDEHACSRMDGLFTNIAPDVPNNFRGLWDSSSLHFDGTTGNFVGTLESGTNLVVDAADNTVVTPDGYTPVAGDVDWQVLIEASTGIAPGRYTITASGGGTWTLDRPVGDLSATGGTWSAGPNTLIERPNESPALGYSTHVKLAGGTGSDEELHIGGHIGTPPTRNYLTSGASGGAETSYTALTFHIRADDGSNLPLVLYPRNSRRSSAFGQPITINDYDWHAYAIVADKGQGSLSYILRKLAAESEKNFLIGDIQHVNFDRLDDFDRHMTERRLAIGSADDDGDATTNAVTGKTETQIPAMPRGQWDQLLNTLQNTDGYMMGGRMIQPVVSSVRKGGDFSATWLAQKSGTNMVIDATNLDEAVPDGYTPHAGNVGWTVRILSGTNFTPGLYTITASSGGKWTFDNDIGTTLSQAGGVWEGFYMPDSGDSPNQWKTGSDPITVITEETSDLISTTSAVRLEGSGGNFASSNNVMRLDLSAAEVVDANLPYVLAGLVKRVSGTGPLYMHTGFDSTALVAFPADKVKTDTVQAFFYKYDTTADPQGELWLGADDGEVWLIDRVLFFPASDWWT